MHPWVKSFLWKALIIAIFLLTPISTSATGEGWLSGWSHRKKITISQDKINADLTNFPLYININSDADLGAISQNDGDDIRFTASDGTTLLKYEKEKWAGGSGTNVTANFWVKTNLNNNTDTEIYLYYGNNSASDGQSATDVWDANFKGVWHMKDSASSTTVTDSTTNTNNVTSQRNTSLLATTGQLGNGFTFNGTTDFLRKASFSNSPSSQMTICSWIKTSQANTFLIQQGRNPSAYANEYVFQLLDNGKGSFWDNNGENFGFAETDNSNSTSITDNAWHHFCFVKNSTSGTYYLDGVADGTVTASLNITYATGDFVIGKDYRDGDRSFSGIMDELKISSSVRTSDWIAAEYDNQKNPSTFYSINNQEDNFGKSWLTGWGYRKKIIIDADQVSDVGSSDYTDFPVLISLSGLSNIKENGTDIRFTTGLGVTELPREIEYYSSSTGNLTAWVKIPSLDYNDDTVIYMYYGNTGATEPNISSNYGSQNVWTNNYSGVWHLKETGTNPTVYDSTSNLNNSTSQTWTPTTGKISGGASLNGSSNSINIGSTNSLNPSSITVSGWVNADVNNKWQYLATKNNQWGFGRDNAGKYYLSSWNSSGTVVADEHSTTTATTGQWEYIVFTYDGSRAKYYVNNNLVIDKAVTGNLQTTTNILAIGSQGGDGNYWDGSIDDVKVSSVARSAGWIATEYTNQNSPASFYNTDSQENSSYTLTYTAGENGSITGISPQTISAGSSGSSVTAVANAHYHFTNWSDSSTANPRTDTNVSQSIGVTANFSIDTYTVTFSAASHGSISGTTSQTINYGADSSSVSAVADSGYHFTNWSDGSTQNPRQILMVTANKSVTANFAADDADSPIISNETSTQNSNSATITWTTNENSSSLVQYGLHQNYGFNTEEADTSTRVLSHSVTLNNLKPCARYFYRVISSDAIGNQSASAQKTFSTSGCPVSTITVGTETTFPITGGTLQIINNLSTAQIEVPNNYANQTATFQINKLDVSPVSNTPTGLSIATNNFYDLIAVTADNQQLDTFNNPITFTISYGSDTENNFDESTLDVYKYDGSNWIKKNCSLNTSANTLTCNLNGFSSYALLGDPRNNSSNSSNNSQSSNSPSQSSCHDSPPASFPDLFQVNTTKTSAKIFFTPLSDTNHYFISFSTRPIAEDYSADVILAREGVQNFTINLLKPNTTYYLKVRGQNGCMPGEWSNIMKIRTTNQVYYKNFSPTSDSYSELTTITSSKTTRLPTITPEATPPQTQTSTPIVEPQKPKKCFLWWCW